MQAEIDELLSDEYAEKERSQHVAILQRVLDGLVAIETAETAAVNGTEPAKYTALTALALIAQACASAASRLSTLPSANSTEPSANSTPIHQFTSRGNHR
jgi:hypothetical protein